MLSGLAGASGLAAVYIGVRLLGSSWRTGMGLGVAAAAAAVLVAGALGARLSASLGDLCKAARLLASGDFRLDLPSGPGGEMARLAAAFGHMATTLGDDLGRLQQLNFSLEERLRRRTAEAEDRAWELESFLYTASHDLRAPVLSIQGFANLLYRNLNRRLDEQSREHLLRIRTNAETMDLLLRDLLEVSRVGKVPEAKEWVDSGEIVATVLRDLEPEIAPLRVRVKVGERLPMVAYAPRLLARVFRNLVDNAIKFMGDQPSPMIAIGCERAAGGHRFFVRDNGAGIKSEDQERVFGLFARGDGTRAPGSGIGLAIVQRIVETHGGRVWVESRPGEGSTFNFTVPGGAPPGRSPADSPISS